MFRTSIALLCLLVPAVSFAADTCPALEMSSTDILSVDTQHPELGITLAGLTLHSIDPDEIDVACLPIVIVEGLELQSIEPDEIDLLVVRELLANTPTARTNEHVLLAHPAGFPELVVTTTGHAVLRLDDLEIREEVVSWRPYVTRAVADLTFSVLDVVPAEAGLAPINLLLGTTTEIMPETPVCARCNM